METGFKPDVVGLRFIVRHSREGGNLFVSFKYIKWIPAFAGMTIKTTYLLDFLNPIVSGSKHVSTFINHKPRPF